MKASTIWRLLGVASIAGVAASGVIIARERRIRADLSTAEISEHLRQRYEAARRREQAP